MEKHPIAYFILIISFILTVIFKWPLILKIFLGIGVIIEGIAIVLRITERTTRHA